MKYSELKQKVLKRRAVRGALTSIIPALKENPVMVNKQVDLLMRKFDWVEVGALHDCFYVKFDNIKLRGRRMYHLWDVYVRFSKGSTTYPRVTYYNLDPAHSDDDLLSSLEENELCVPVVREPMLIPARHPHISIGTGEACLGEFERAIYNGLAVYNYAAALLTIKQFLLSWNVDSPYWNINSCYTYFNEGSKYVHLTYAELTYIYIADMHKSNNTRLVADICEYVKGRTGKFDISWTGKVEMFHVSQLDRLDKFLSDIVWHNDEVKWKEVKNGDHPFLCMWSRLSSLKSVHWSWSGVTTSKSNSDKLEDVWNDFSFIIRRFRTRYADAFTRFGIIYYYYNHPLGNEWRYEHWDKVMNKRMTTMLNEVIDSVKIASSAEHRAMHRRRIGTESYRELDLDKIDKLIYDSGVVAYRLAIKDSKEQIRRLRDEANDFKISYNEA